MSGTLVKTIGFEWMLFGIAIINFLYAPLLVSLRNPPTKEEKKVITIIIKLINFFLIVIYVIQIFFSFPYT